MNCSIYSSLFDSLCEKKGKVSNMEFDEWLIEVIGISRGRYDSLSEPYKEKIKAEYYSEFPEKLNDGVRL